MKNSKLFSWALIHSLGVVVYVVLLSLFMRNIDNIFSGSDDNFLAPLFMILLFVSSALVTGSLVLAKPIMLYLDGQKKDGVKLLFFTGASLFIYLILVFGLLMIR